MRLGNRKGVFKPNKIIRSTVSVFWSWVWNKSVYNILGRRNCQQASKNSCCEEKNDETQVTDGHSTKSREEWARRNGPQWKSSRSSTDSQGDDEKTRGSRGALEEVHRMNQGQKAGRKEKHGETIQRTSKCPRQKRKDSAYTRWVLMWWCPKWCWGTAESFMNMWLTLINRSSKRLFWVMSENAQPSARQSKYRDRSNRKDWKGWSMG